MKIFISNLLLAISELFHGASFAVSCRCAVISAIIFSISGAILGILISEDIVFIPKDLWIYNHGLFSSTLLISTISALGGTVIGMVVGSIGFYLSKDLWQDDEDFD